MLRLSRMEDEGWDYVFFFFKQRQYDVSIGRLCVFFLNKDNMMFQLGEN